MQTATVNNSLGNRSHRLRTEYNRIAKIVLCSVKSHVDVVNVVLNVHRNRTGEGVMEVEGRGGRLYTYRYTITTRMAPALRWAVMRAILMFH